MGNIIKVNCRELYSNCIYINAQLERLKEVVTEMKEINEEIMNAWDGEDYDVFYKTFDAYLTSFDDIETAISNNNAKMKLIARRHGNIDTILEETSKNWGDTNVH